MPKLNQRFWTIKGLTEGAYTNQIYGFIKRKILELVLSPHTKLPSNRVLGDWNGIHRNTVLNAYRLLAEEGWIYTLNGCGTFVSETFPGHEKFYKPKRILDKLPVPIDVLNRINEPEQEPVLAFVTIGFDTPGPEYAPVWHHHNLMHVHVKRYRGLDQIGRVKDLKAEELKSAIFHYLDVIRQFSITASCLEVVMGRSQALNRVLAALLCAGDQVLNTAPQDILLHQALQNRGAVTHSLDMSRPGFITDLEDFLAGNTIKALYLRPQCSFPDSGHLKPQQCAELIRLSKCHGFYILEEDDYHEFWYESKPFKELIRYDHGGHVIYIGALSMLTPYTQQIRTVVAAPEFIDLLSSVPRERFEFRDILQEQIIADLFSSGKIFPYITKMKMEKKKHLEEIWLQMDNYLHLGVHMVKPSSGLSLWLDFHTDTNLKESMDLIARANREIPYHPDGTRPGPGISKMRLGFGSWEIQEAQTAAKVLQEKFIGER